MKSGGDERKNISSEKLNTFSNAWDPFSNDELGTHDHVIKQSDLETLETTHVIVGTRAIQPEDGNYPGIVPECNREGEVHVLQPTLDVSNVPSPAKEIYNSGPNNTYDSVNSRTSSRPRRVSRMPARFNDFVVDSKLKYGIEKSVNYSYLNEENKCFISNLKL